VASGLEYLHKQNPPVIHQDIKPDNVLIDANGQFMITDFGISAKARSTLRKSAPKHNTSAGTIAYMPPERFSKDNTPVMASDIWALGATLYELLTGDTPFGENGGLIQKSGAEIPNIRANCSEELKNVVLLCLELETWDRPSAKTIVEWCVIHSKGGKISFPKQRGEKTKFKLKPKYISLSIVGGIAGLLLLLFITGVLTWTSPEKMKLFEEYKKAASINYQNAQELDDTDLYSITLDYCNYALSIKKDRELEAIKTEIESRR
jgi:serine/threonine protein kinase